ncbi:MAG: hypothetical protein IT459_13150 [Planctomycetes bacterium]|nr:hypothetical protein [Planctomycetota bacterium]
MVAVLTFAQTFGGHAALLHAHDGIGQHVHVLASRSAEFSSWVPAEWHHSQHEGDESQHLRTDVPADGHGGVLIELPRVLDATPNSYVAGAAAIAHLHAFHVSVHCGGVMYRPPPLPTSVRAELLQVRRQRSGTAILLGSSRALLI